ncbi:tRNA lysidine(34) synthetase TilS [Croceibacterium ferulae]|uniref:tRNA lysidine(34) synthetase TilS n=1 Tax=Croceibacterium ferulae TaxID=1854641 RepID=UPI001F4D5D65|nr:tRNA lysidine(34) synthetase TilS [Croceibacterium ferulae]
MTATAAGSAAAIEADLAARFAASLARLLPGAAGSIGQAPIGLAVSGGADSLALLLLMQATRPGGYAVAAVDHGLRPEAAAECAAVADLCGERGVSCAVLRVTPAAGNVQAAARDARYAALAGWAAEHGLCAIATGHHADDQAETLLMRLNRGSGLAGLAGVRASGLVPGTALPLLRPLLGFRRQELAWLVAAHGLSPAADPSNSDRRFDRVRIRQAIGQADWLDAAALADSAAHLAQAAAALDWAGQREWAERVEPIDGSLRYRPQAPRAIRLVVASRAIAALGQPPRGGDVARLLDRLEAGGSGNVAGVLARATADGWLFSPEPPRSR